MAPKNRISVHEARSISLRILADTERSLKADRLADAARLGGTVVALDETLDLVRGTYIDRSLHAFMNDCAKTILAAQAQDHPDTHLVALLADAVRVARELAKECQTRGRR